MIHFAAIIVAAFIIITVFNYFILQPYKVDGESMEPTLHGGNRLFILKTGKVISDILGSDFVPKRGEIIVFNHPQEDRKLIKRVIGLPNERIVIKNNQIIIYNDKNLNGLIYKPDFDPELPNFHSSEKTHDIIVNQGEVFVIGDNRLPGKSLDSRSESLGNVSVENIEGTVIIRILPLQDIKLF